MFFEHEFFSKIGVILYPGTNYIKEVIPGSLAKNTFPDVERDWEVSKINGQRYTGGEIVNKNQDITEFTIKDTISFNPPNVFYFNHLIMTL